MMRWLGAAAHRGPAKRGVAWRSCGQGRGKGGSRRGHAGEQAAWGMGLNGAGSVACRLET